MNATLLPKRTEFIHHQPQNFILVENEADGGVLIRAARDNFSESRKEAFIREIAAEGFIPDQLQEFSDSHSSVCKEVKWIVDNSWVRIHFASSKEAKRMFVITLVIVGCLWLALMGITVILRAG